MGLSWVARKPRSSVPSRLTGHFWIDSPPKKRPPGGWRTRSYCRGCAQAKRLVVGGKRSVVWVTLPGAFKETGGTCCYLQTRGTRQAMKTLVNPGWGQVLRIFFFLVLNDAGERDVIYKNAYTFRGQHVWSQWTTSILKHNLFKRRNFWHRHCCRVPPAFYRTVQKVCGELVLNLQQDTKCFTFTFHVDMLCTNWAADYCPKSLQRYGRRPFVWVSFSLRRSLYGLKELTSAVKNIRHLTILTVISCLLQ